MEGAYEKLKGIVLTPGINKALHDSFLKLNQDFFIHINS
jgi:hypothetical protein